jgi:hypothetical protein
MTNPPISDTFLAFRDQCIWLQTCFNTYAALFEAGDETEGLMRRVAPQFFTELNEVLIEYCLLQVCRLTDPVGNLGHANLTVKYINSLLEEADLMTTAISDASFGIARYRDLINDSRNKVISHADLATITAGTPIGEHAAADVRAFLDHLYTYVDEVGNAVGVGPLDFRATSGPGDVLDLLRFMRAGTRAMNSDS